MPGHLVAMLASYFYRQTAVQYIDAAFSSLSLFVIIIFLKRGKEETKRKEKKRNEKKRKETRRETRGFYHRTADDLLIDRIELFFWCFAFSLVLAL